jgi:hypothetical protein
MFHQLTLCQMTFCRLLSPLARNKHLFIFPCPIKTKLPLG